MSSHSKDDRWFHYGWAGEDRVTGEEADQAMESRIKKAKIGTDLGVELGLNCVRGTGAEVIGPIPFARGW